MRRTAADLADEALEHLDVLREHVRLAGAESRTAMRSTRNRIADACSVVDADVIRAAVATRLDALEERLRVVASSATGPPRRARPVRPGCG